MKIKRLLILVIVLMMFTSLAAAFTLNLDCNTPVREAQAVNCNLRLQHDTANEEVQGIQFKLGLPPGFSGTDPLITIPNSLPRSVSVTWLSVNNNFVVLDTSGASIPDGTLLATLNFKAGNSGGTFTAREKVPDFRFSSSPVSVTGGDSLPPPPSETCSDGIRNQGETSIDCGGPCAACQAACTAVIANCNRAGVNCPGNIPVAQVICGGSTPVCNSGRGLCEAAASISCANNERVIDRNCSCDGQREILKGICTGVIQEIRDSINNNDSDLSIVSRIAAAIRSFFARLFG